MSVENEELNAEELEKTDEKVTDGNEEKSKVEGQKATINIDDLKKEFIDMVRKEEKDKLYKSMEKIKEELRLEKEAKVALEAKTKEYEEKNLTAEEKTNLKLEELSNANLELKEALEKVSTTAAQEIYRVQLESERDKMLSKYGTEIIPSMISGSTIEEIRESAEEAHRVYGEIVTKATENLTKTRRETATTNTISPKAAATQKAFDVDISKIKDPKEWETVKAELLEKAFQGGQR